MKGSGDERDATGIAKKYFSGARKNVRRLDQRSLQNYRVANFIAPEISTTRKKTVDLLFSQPASRCSMRAIKSSASPIEGAPRRHLCSVARDFIEMKNSDLAALLFQMLLDRIWEGPASKTATAAFATAAACHDAWRFSDLRFRSALRIRWHRAVRPVLPGRWGGPGKSNHHRRHLR